MEVFDRNNLLVLYPGAALLQLLFLLVTAACRRRRLHTLAHLAGGLSFSAVAVASLCLAQTYAVRQIVVTSLVCAWGVRLSFYLVYRAVHLGPSLAPHHDRFVHAATAGSAAATADAQLFVGFWTFQAVWVLVVSLPVVFVNAPSTAGHPAVALWSRWTDEAGVAVWAVGMLAEVAADTQKFNWKDNPDNRGRWCQFGLWRWSRHPNYLGEMLMWWGLWLVSLTTVTGGQWAAVISPVFTTAILFFLSGIPVLEQKSDARYGSLASYRHYKRTTSVLLPLPPVIYKFFPPWLKCCLCCEFPFYNHLDADDEDDERKNIAGGGPTFV